MFDLLLILAAWLLASLALTLIQIIGKKNEVKSSKEKPKSWSDT